jgi:hypothetical protein
LESEDGELGGRTDTVAKILDALTRAGVEFIDGTAAGQGSAYESLCGVSRALRPRVD